MKRILAKKTIEAGLLAGLLGGASLLTVARDAQAQTATYASTRRQINACVLAQTSGSTTFRPYAFYELDARTDLKPGNWDIINPLAPATLGGAGFRRWSDSNKNPIAGASTDGSFLQGAPLTKNMAPYWEVILDSIADDDLRKMDIALLPVTASITLTNEQRERLRRFVDGGGTLWISLETNQVGIGNFFLDIANGASVGTTPFGLGLHPLLRSPNLLSSYELAQIPGSSIGSSKFVDPLDLNRNVPYMTQVVGNPGAADGSATIAAGDYGAGHIVVVACPMAGNINSEISNLGKNLRSAPAFDSDLKLLANMIAWTTSAPTQGGNSRRTNSTGERIGSQLGEKWTWTPKSGSGGGGSGSGAVIFKGLVFYVDNANMLHAFDRDPAQNLLNGPNGSDDGIVDFALGTPYDEVFRVDTGLKGQVSTPTVGSTITGDYVAVTSATGDTAIFSIGGKGLTKVSEFLGTGGSTLRPVVPSPIFSEGLFFAVTSAPPVGGLDGTWRIVALDPATGANVFAGATGASSPDVNAIAPYANTANNLALPGLSNLTGPIAMGYIKDTLTGALDKVIYCPTDPPMLNGNSTNNSVIAGLWFGVKNEPLQSFPYAPGGSTVFLNQAFRPQQSGGRNFVPWYVNSTKTTDPLNPVLRVVTHKADGSYVTSNPLVYGTQYRVVMGGIPTTANSAGTAPAPVRETEILLTAPIADNEELYADYTLNWPAIPLTDFAKAPVLMTRGDMIHIARNPYSTVSPNPTGLAQPPVAQIIGGTAISAEETVIFNSTFSNGLSGTVGRIYAVREQYGSAASAANSKGIGTQIPWTYSPEPMAGTVNNQPSSLVNNDPGTVSTNTALTGFVPVGSPAIANDTVYVVGTTKGSQPFTVIMALRANPSMTIAFGANTGIPTPLPLGWKVRVFNRTQQASDVNWFDQAPHLENGMQFSIDPDGGNLSIFDCAFTRNAGVLNLGEPIVIAALPPIVLNTKGANVQPPPVVVVLPNPADPTAASPLDNLIWFMAIPQNDSKLPSNLAGLTPTSGPALIGDALYFSSSKGVISVDIRGSGRQHNLRVTTDASVHPDNSDGNLRVHLLPQGGGPNNSGGGVGALEPPTGTERTLVMGLPNGITAYDSRPTLIADGSRLLEVDYGGNALWSMEASLSYVQDSNGNSIATKTNLARPSVAHRIGLDEFLFADTNNNRVALADRGGAAQWELTNFNNDMGFVPPGFPLTLNSPTDIQYIEDAPAPNITFSGPNKTTYTYNGGMNNQAITRRYLIADSGNFRLLEIVDVVNANTGAPVVMSGPNGNITMSRQCSFVSKALGEQNLKKRYRSIQEFSVPNSATPDVYIVSAIANTASSITPSGVPGGAGFSVTASGSNQEGLGGSIEILHRNFSDATQDGATVAVFSSLNLQQTGAGGKVTTTYIPLNNVTFCKGFYDTGFDPNAASPLHQFAYQYMIADSNGCYVVNSTGTILWMLTSAEYYAMTGRPLRASSIQRLTQADFNTTNTMDSRPWYARYLITNRYEGPDALPELLANNASRVVRGQIHGEVFEIRSLDYEAKGFNSGIIYQSNAKTGTVIQLTLGGNSPIMWLFPNETQTSYQSAASKTLYTIVRSVGSKESSTFTSLLQQPTSAERPN